MARPVAVIFIDKGVSIYRRDGTPYWQLRVTRHGYRSRESLKTSDVEAAKAIARKRADELLSQAEGVVIPRDISFEELFKVYKRHAELRNTEATRDLNYDNLGRISAYLGRRIQVQRPLMASDFSPAAIEAYVHQRIKEGIAPVTINRELGSLSILFARAKKARLIRTNPAAEVEKLPLAVNKIPATLSAGEVKALLQAAADPVDFHGRGGKGKGNFRLRSTPLHDLLLLILNTGARLGEALYLEWDDIDLERSLVAFSNKPEHRIKDRDQRVVRANDVLLAMLRQRRMRAGANRWVFPSMFGDVLDRKNILRELKGAQRRAKLRKVNFLILRHTALTEGARSGMPPFVLKELAGHATIRTTERYYVGKVGSSDWVPPRIGG